MSEKYCCNCDMWEGIMYDCEAKCNHNRQRGYREYTRYDMHCEGYLEKKSLLAAGLGEELRPRIEIMKEQFEFNPKEFVPRNELSNNDFETFKKMLTGFGVEFKVVTGNGCNIIHVEKGYKKVKACNGCYCEYVFDLDGEFNCMGIFQEGE